MSNHPNANYQGLHQVFGNRPYPITESFSTRAFGVGVRQRSAAVAVQVSTATTYTTPPANAISL